MPNYCPVPSLLWPHFHPHSRQCSQREPTVNYKVYGTNSTVIPTIVVGVSWEQYMTRHKSRTFCHKAASAFEKGNNIAIFYLTNKRARRFKRLFPLLTLRWGTYFVTFLKKNVKSRTVTHKCTIHMSSRKRPLFHVRQRESTPNIDSEHY